MPAAVQCADAFHIVKWATEALDEVRRGVWNTARATARTEPGRRRGRPTADAPPRPGSDLARGLKNSRYALWKNPENLTVRQGAKLEWIAKTDPRLYRAYLLKEGLRMVFALLGEAGKDALDRWVSWARRCRIPAFVDLQKRIVRHRKTIDATLEHGLSNGLIESTKYEDPGPDSNGVRLYQTRSTRSTGHARPRRLLPTTTRPRDPEMTHGSGRGAVFRVSSALLM